MPPAGVFSPDVARAAGLRALLGLDVAGTGALFEAFGGLPPRSQAAYLSRDSALAPVLAAIKVIQTFLLSAAMFALGTGVNFRKLLGMGGRPIVLGASATGIVTLLGLGGVLLVTP